MAIKIRQLNKISWLDSREIFIDKLLHGRIQDEVQAREHAAILGIYPKSSITLIAARPISTQEQYELQDFSPEFLVDLFPSCSTSICDGDLIMLVYGQKVNSNNKSLIIEARNFFQKYQLQACVSLPVQNFISLASQYARNILTLKIYSSRGITEPVIFDEEYAILKLLGHLNPNDLEILCYPGITKLHEIDKLKGTNHILTLYAFILMNGNHSDAAKLLGIYYNTLKYRLNKIEMVIGSKWHDIIPTLYLSIKILSLLYPSEMKDCKQLETTIVYWRR